MLNSHLKQHRSTINNATLNQLTRRPLIAAITLALGGSAQAATLTVTNTNDAGLGSLRQAVSNANASAGADTIVFDNTLINSTITLATGEIQVTDDLTVTGPVAGDASSMTLDGNNNSRLFHVTDNSIALTLSNLTLTRGYGYGIGGGAAISGGLLTLNDALVNDNTVIAPRNGFTGPVAAIAGGGVFASTITLNRSTVSNNTLIGASCLCRGGGLFASTITLNQSTVSGNSSESYGGGLVAEMITLNQSTVSGNSSESGGGMVSRGRGDITLIQSTITNNISNVGAGGLEMNRSLRNINFFNTILADNDGPEGNVGFRPARVSPPNVNSSHTIFGDDPSEITGTNTANVFTNAPGLGPLQFNGGSTQTHLPNSTSPALDVGNNVDATSAFDQRGLSRIFNDIVDIGSVERQPIPIRPIPVLGLPGLLALIASLTALVGWQRRIK